MRVEEKNNVTLKYPDNIGFAFNNCLIVAENKQLKTLSIVIRNGERNSKIYLDAMNGKCYGDIKDYIQTFFDTLSFTNVNYEREEKTDLGVTLSFEVVAKLEDESEAVFRFETFYIWGAIQKVGEVYNGYRNITYFKNYPFTFGVFADGEGSILFSRDGVAEKFVVLDEQGVWNVPLTAKDDAKEFYLISDCTGVFREVVFDNTFDMTFRYVHEGERNEKIKINVVDTCEQGVYLRWVNRHGFYCYYLFKKGDEQRKTASETFMRNNLLADNDEYGFEGLAGQHQMMMREDVLPICAPLVDSETFDFLFDLATSPVVHLFTGYKDAKPQWVAVSILAGSYTKSRANLQDFICSVQMPNINIQKL